MTTIPIATSAAYRAAAHLHKTGPLPTADLYTQVEFPAEQSRRSQVLSRSFSNDWLISTPRGIDISDWARKHFDSLGQDAPEPSAKEKYVGQVAAVREARLPHEVKPLSAKYRVSSAGFRDDVPAYSVRDNMRFSTLGRLT